MNGMSIKNAETGLPCLVSETRLAPPQWIEGYIFDPDRLDSRFVVELLVSARPVALMRAELYDDRLRELGVGDGCYRFAFSLDRANMDSATSLEVKLANSDYSLGPPIQINGTAADAEPCSGPGEVRWRGGLCFSGWLSADPPRAQPEVRAFIEGKCVARSKALQWTHIDDGEEPKPVRRFELRLPTEFADGRVRSASFLDDLGRPLLGGLCAFLAFNDGLTAFIEERAEIRSEKIRSQLFDRCFPNSLPFDLFEDWSRAFPDAAATVDSPGKVALALVGDGDVQLTISSLQTQAGLDWIACTLGEGCAQFAFNTRRLSEFLDTAAADRDFIIFALAGTVFRQNGLARLADAMRRFPAAPAVYCDLTIVGEDGCEWPIAFPCFDYERMLEQGYCAYVFGARAANIRDAAPRCAGNLFRLFNATLERSRPNGAPAAAPVHVPRFLARIPQVDRTHGASQLVQATRDHLSVRGVSATVTTGREGLFPSARVQRAVPKAKVSLLIPLPNGVHTASQWLESLNRTINLNEHEVIAIADESRGRRSSDALNAIIDGGACVVPVPGDLNLARRIRAGAEHASGEFLLVMRGDVQALETGWLEEMLGRAAESDVGVVGSALVSQSGLIRQCGIVLGVGYATSQAFGDRVDGDSGYADQLLVARECSATTSDCMLTRRDVFEALGGFNEVSFPSYYGDIDYCLRVRSRGYRIVVTPNAKLRLVVGSASKLNRFSGQFAEASLELSRLRAVWGGALLDDPYYNPALALDGAPYSALAWPPRHSDPRMPTTPVPRPIPAGF